MPINKAGTNEWPSRITERPVPPAPSISLRHTLASIAAVPTPRFAFIRREVTELIEALAPFAGLANEHDLTALEDADTLEVLVRDVKRAAVVYARATGGEG